MIDFSQASLFKNLHAAYEGPINFQTTFVRKTLFLLCVLQGCALPPVRRSMRSGKCVPRLLSIIYQVEKSVILAHYTSIKKCPFFSEIMLMEGARQFAS